MCLNRMRDLGYRQPLIHYDEEKRGPAWNFMQCLGEDSVAIIQDDFLLTVEEHVLHFAISEANGDVVSGYTHGYHESEDFIDVELDMDLRITCNGGCLFLLDALTAYELKKWDGNINKPLPQVIGEFCRDTGRKYLITGKNYGEHIGEISAVRSAPYPIIKRERNEK